MITTRYGDEGFTQLHERRVRKDSLHIDTIGTLDEAMADISLAASFCSDVNEQKALFHIIKTIYEISAVIAGYDENLQRYFYQTDDMEMLIDGMPLITEFTLGYKNQYASFLNKARTTVRRAERQLVSFLYDQPLANAKDNEMILIYINRLSDYLFALAELNKNENSR